MSVLGRFETESCSRGVLKLKKRRRGVLRLRSRRWGVLRLQSRRWGVLRLQSRRWGVLKLEILKLQIDPTTASKTPGQFKSRRGGSSPVLNF